MHVHDCLQWKRFTRTTCYSDGTDEGDDDDITGRLALACRQLINHHILMYND